jgi:hypothetical protein
MNTANGNGICYGKGCGDGCGDGDGDDYGNGICYGKGKGWGNGGGVGDGYGGGSRMRFSKRVWATATERAKDEVQ